MSSMCSRSGIRLALLSAVVFLTQLASPAFGMVGEGNFPKGPNPQVTPGELCDHADALRYPERIRYCNRDVDSQLKNDIIQTYDRQFGYRISTMPRGQFKIDHYIPLCAGGGNDRQNLWPQHESVYSITDPLEPLICNKMASGRLKQIDAVTLVKKAKNDLTKVAEVIRYVNAL